MSDFSERIMSAYEQPEDERLCALRRVLMNEKGASIANAVDVTEEERRMMMRAADNLTNKARYTAPEIRVETCWLPLMHALLSDDQRKALEVHWGTDPEDAP